MESIADSSPNHCWVCLVLLADSGGEPSKIRESHHIVPRAYGGTNGPQIPLCIEHHDLLHQLASSLIAGKSIANRLPVDSRQSTKLVYLANVIRDAHRKFSQDPNKRVSLSITLPKTEMSKVADLAKFHGVGRKELLIRLVRIEYNKIFPTKL